MAMHLKLLELLQVASTLSKERCIYWIYVNEVLCILIGEYNPYIKCLRIIL